MWQPYLKVIKKKAVNAIHIMDRYHVMALMSKAIGKLRAEEAKTVESDGLEPVLTNARFILLKRPENLTDKQENKAGRSGAIQSAFHQSVPVEGRFPAILEVRQPLLCGQVSGCLVYTGDEIQNRTHEENGQTLRKHHPLLMNWFKARGELSSGVVEGFNSKAKLTMRKSYGLRTFRGIEIALYDAMGDLPEPKLTHRFF